jgi:hypothetical protein
MKKNRTANIETYKTRAEIIAENPVRKGDEEFPEQQSSLRRSEHLFVHLEPIQPEEKYSFHYAEPEQLPVSQVRCGSLHGEPSDRPAQSRPA